MRRRSFYARREPPRIGPSGLDGRSAGGEDAGVAPRRCTAVSDTPPPRRPALGSAKKPPVPKARPAPPEPEFEVVVDAGDEFEVVDEAPRVRRL